MYWNTQTFQRQCPLGCAGLFVLVLTLTFASPLRAAAAVDSTAPSVGLISPTSATVGTNVTLSSPYSDAVGVTSCNLYVDNNNQGNMTLAGVASGVATGTHTFLLTGSYRVYARCFDEAGNIGLGTPVTVTVSTSALSAPAADTTAPSAPVNLTRTTPNDDNTPTFTWFPAQDNIAVATYEVRLDQGLLTAVGNVTSFTSVAIAAGSHTFGVRALDGAGNRSETVTVSFTISATPTPPSSTASFIPAPPPYPLEAMASEAERLAADGQGIVPNPQAGIPACQMDLGVAAGKVTAVFGSIAETKLRTAVINFTACGTVTTFLLGPGERLGVVNSYKSAFGRLPSTAAHWFDAIKIGNGRFPGENSASAEAEAKTRFRAIYRRAPAMASQNDKAAVNIMAYGLRPFPRNVNSERNAILTYKAIFGRGPTSATDWDAVRAIAYSGARR